jgi:glycosyltransferase involved in cell wall biosynthesis
MWCGRPAVVTNVGGNGELCVDGETGFVAAAPTADSLAEAMEAAWAKRTEWNQMGRIARSRVEQIIPKDPVEDFCRELITCASAPTAQSPTENATSAR